MKLSLWIAHPQTVIVALHASTVSDCWLAGDTIWKFRASDAEENETSAVPNIHGGPKK